MKFWKQRTPATEAQAASALLRCSFCNKSQRDVRRLIAGPAAYICDECVDICLDILSDDRLLDRGEPEPAHPDASPVPASGVVQRCSLCCTAFPREHLTSIGPRGLLCGPCVDAVRLAADTHDDGSDPASSAT